MFFSYGLELEQIKGTISSDTFKEPSQREDAKKVTSKRVNIKN
jgi:large subunit ribosomal protein L27e